MVEVVLVEDQEEGLPNKAKKVIFWPKKRPFFLAIIFLRKKQKKISNLKNGVE